MGMSRNVEECCVTSHPTLKETTLSHRMATENSHAAHTLKPYPYQVAGHAAQGEPMNKINSQYVNLYSLSSRKVLYVLQC